MKWPEFKALSQARAGLLALSLLEDYNIYIIQYFFVVQGLIFSQSQWIKFIYASILHMRALFVMLVSILQRTPFQMNVKLPYFKNA